MKKFIYAFFISLLVLSSKQYYNNDTEKDKFIEDLISKMTLAEKAGQMNQYNGFWDATGPMPEGDYQKKRYNELKNGQLKPLFEFLAPAY